MIRSELVARIAAENPDLTQRDAERVVTTILEAITEQLMHGDRVELRGFGTFSVKRRDARKGRNPRTGEPVDVAAKGAVYFRPGREMNRRLNTKKP